MPKNEPWKKEPTLKPKTKADLWRQYGLERPSKPRYEGLKGIYWYLFSIWTRKRDFEAFGTCISCGKRVDSWRDYDPGHFIAAGSGGFGLVFDEKNVNGECKRCNGFDEMHLYGYARNLDIRYGQDTAVSLENRYADHKFKGSVTKEWSKKEYDTKIRGLLALPTIQEVVQSLH